MKKRTTTITQNGAQNRPSAPPDLPTVDIEIGGHIYKACFDLQTLFDSEEQLILLGHREANLLQILPDFSATSARRLFAVAIQRFHPGIPFAERLRIVSRDMDAVFVVANKLAELWLASTAKAKEGGAAKAVDPSRASTGEAAGGSSSISE